MSDKNERFIEIDNPYRPYHLEKGKWFFDCSVIDKIAKILTSKIG